MKLSIPFVILAASLAVLLAQAPAPPTAATIPTSQMHSEPGSTFQIADGQLPNPLTFIAYGDQRFTDPPTRPRQTRVFASGW